MDVVPVLYDGNPAWPSPDLLWKMADDTGAHLFGASPTYQSILEKAGIVPKERFTLDEARNHRARRFTGDRRVPATGSTRT